MLSSQARLLAARAAPARLLHTSRAALAAKTSGGKDPAVSQGHSSLEGGKQNQSPQDFQSQQVKAGKARDNSTNPVDAASQSSQAQAPREGSGNQEGVGFAEQIGGASASGGGASAHEGKTEEAQAPGVWSSIKQGLGLGTDSGDVKQNQGGGRGVTGTGSARQFHTSATALTQATPGNNARDASRQTDAPGAQSDHLKHKQPGEPDRGKGNAAPEPKLPSHETTESAPQYTKDTFAKQDPRRAGEARQFHTSATARAPHTTDSYSKDVDTQGASGKTHKVDSSSPATDVPNTGDASSPGRDTTQSGGFHQAGPGDAEYASMNQSEPYDKSGPESERQRYGGKESLKQDKGAEQSREGEGPTGDSAGGRK